jgi:hypothetical protein
MATVVRRNGQWAIIASHTDFAYLMGAADFGAQEAVKQDSTDEVAQMALILVRDIERQVTELGRST